MPFDRLRQLTANGYAHAIPTVLKMEFEGGVVLKFHFKIHFLRSSCFLKDQYSSSFHVVGKQVKIKQHMCKDGSPPKIALPSSYLQELSASIF